MFIQTEPTPNPLTLKFLPGRVVMQEGTAFYQNQDEAIDSPLANRIFKIDGITGVFLGSEFITVTKSNQTDWPLLKPSVLGAITDHYDSGEQTVKNNKQKEDSFDNNDNGNDSEIVKQIKELINTRVRPAVAMDGGDIIYKKFEKGIVYLHMQGACSGCPSSTATLKMGIENMLKHYVPEVKEVRPVNA